MLSTMSTADVWSVILERPMKASIRTPSDWLAGRSASWRHGRWRLKIKSLLALAPELTPVVAYVEYA
jgi:hypothetical protein